MIDEQWRTAAINNQINEPTREEQRQLIKTTLANAILQGLSIQTKTQLDAATIKNLSEQIAVAKDKNDIERFKAEIEANFKGLDKITGNLLEQVIHKLAELGNVNIDTTPIKRK